MTNKFEPAAASSGRTFSQCVHMDRAGRVVVPAGIRKALNIWDEQDLTITLEDDCIRLQTIDAGLKRIREIARHKRKRSGSIVDEFIAERRAEAAQD
ncbi:MAG: AbrB/MazE/SpoVT family DNA-binding domain-containing protein [Gammaproteobacteria bacterium]|nr:AbrB/MazE/SpoVT family DNA-binding domain-containing protein [Gammaproteobacteria bacterium]